MCCCMRQEFWCCLRGWCSPVSRSLCRATASRRGPVKLGSASRSGSEWVFTPFASLLSCNYYKLTTTISVAWTSLLTAYVKCIKLFFGFHKRSSVINTLLQLGLPSFDTVLHNMRIRSANNLHLLDNSVVSVSCRLWYECLRQCFCTCLCFHVFTLCFCVFFSFYLCVCVLFLFCGSLWSDSNKERKKRKKEFAQT